MLRKYYSALVKKYQQTCFQREDFLCLDFLKKLPEGTTYNYLEVASGLARFPTILKEKFKNIRITCLDINKELVDLARYNGFTALQENILETSLADDSFDIVHCSHLIEHFGYPQVTDLLDRLVRLTKRDGYIIIRSPLLHEGFYRDIDHVRPYPPESILSYFQNPQRQRVGRASLEEVGRWYRRSAVAIGSGDNNLATNLLNFFLKSLWVYLGFPFSRKNGYVLILKKIE